MMFLIAPKGRCAGRRNPFFGAVLGLFSSFMIGASVFIGRHDGEHWPLAVAGIVCIGLIALALARFIALSRDGSGS
jgi:hypothetical protein